MRTCYNSEAYNHERGAAIPLALFLVLFIMGISAIFTAISRGGLRQIKVIEGAKDTFQIAEGSAHDLMSQMSRAPELWREKNVLSTLPIGYTEYSPQTYSSTNGIPTCSGTACQRQMFPIGGGVVKNFGPLGSEGDQIDSSATIIDQLDPEYPRAADLQLNGREGWVQVEKLDEVTVSSSNLGGSLNNNTTGGTTAGGMRFRVTGESLRQIRGRKGKSTVVYVVEIPST